MKEKEPKEQDATSIQTFRQKDRYQTELWRALYQKAPKGQFLTIRNNLTEAFIKFPDFLRRSFQANRQNEID